MIGPTSFGAGASPSFQGGSAGPSTAKSGDGIFDASGWNVVFGQGNTLEATRAEAGALGNYTPFILLAMGAFVVWRMTRK